MLVSLIKDLGSNGKARNLISIEAINESWLVKSNKNVNVLNPDGNAVADAVLKTGSFYCLKINVSDEYALLYAELIDESRQKTFRYHFSRRQHIKTCRRGIFI